MRSSSLILFSLPQLRFQPSQSKNKLYLGNIPKDMMKDAIHAKLAEHVKGSGCSVACCQEVAQMLHSTHCIPHSACKVGPFLLLLQVLLMLKLSCPKSSQDQGGASALWNFTTIQQLHMPKHCWAVTTFSKQPPRIIANTALLMSQSTFFADCVQTSCQYCIPLQESTIYHRNLLPLQARPL